MLLSEIPMHDFPKSYCIIPKLWIISMFWFSTNCTSSTKLDIDFQFCIYLWRQFPELAFSVCFNNLIQDARMVYRAAKVHSEIPPLLLWRESSLFFFGRGTIMVRKPPRSGYFPLRRLRGIRLGYMNGSITRTKALRVISKSCHRVSRPFASRIKM